MFESFSYNYEYDFQHVKIIIIGRTLQITTDSDGGRANILILSAWLEGLTVWHVKNIK